MPEERPRPKYGEYATPEDQARAMGVTDARPSPPVQAAVAAPLGTPPSARPVPAPHAGTARRRPWDRIMSILLLGYGLLSVVFGAPTYADLGSLIQSVYGMQGIGEFTSEGLADSIGTAIIAFNIVLYVIVFTVTLMRLRAGRLAFFVPLIGGAVSGIVAISLLSVVMVGDPAFQEYLRSSR